MAVNVQYTNLESGVLENMNQIDEAICAYLGMPVSQTDYALDWFNVVGLMHATGRRGAALHAELGRWYTPSERDDETVERAYNRRRDELTTVANFLECHYSVSSFTTSGRF